MMQIVTTHSNRFIGLAQRIFGQVRKPKMFLIVAVGIVVFIGLFWFMNTYIRPFLASIPIAQTEFTPSAPTVKPGDQFSINMQLSGETITAADVYITYTSDKVVYLADLPNPVTGFNQISDYFDAPPIVEELTSNADNTKTLHLVLVSQKANSNVAQFSLKFKAHALGEAAFTIDTSRSKLSGSVGTDLSSASYISFPEGVLRTTVIIAEDGADATPTHTHTPTPSDDSDPTVTPTVDPSISPSISPSTSPSISPTLTIMPTASLVPSPTATLSPTVTSTPTPAPTTVAQNPNVTLDMKVRLQGVVTQPKEAYRQQTMKILVQSTDKSFREEQAISFTVNGEALWVGSMKIVNVPTSKTFNIYIKGTKHLQRKICTLAPTETVPGQYDCSSGQITLKEGTNVVDMSKIFVLAGDIPIQNGIVDSVDVIYVRKNLGVTSPAVLSRADFNLDGIVDTQDYTLAVTALGFKYDEK